MKNMTNRDVMNLFNNTELAIGVLEDTEKLALSILEEPIDLKNQMAMKGILIQANEILNQHIYTEKTIIEWEDRFQIIVDKWYDKNQAFITEESDLLYEDLKK